MTTLQEYISIIGGVQGGLLSIMLIADARMTLASRILGVLCLTFTSVFLLPFLLINVQNHSIAWAIGWVFYLPAASGALLYLYSRSALLQKKLEIRDLFHLIPWLSCYALTADVFIADPQEMGEWISGGHPQTWRLQASEIIIFAQAFVYLGWTIKIIGRYRLQANNSLANFNPSVFKWLLLIQGLALLIWTLEAILAFAFVPILISNIAKLFLVLLVYTIGFMQWRNPQLFTISELSKTQDGTVSKQFEKTETSPNGELDPAIRAQLFETLKNKFESQALYLDHKLTLTRLAAATGLSKHHLSEVLNRHAEKNFYEFVNAYRVEFVCKRLTDNMNQKILDIAFEAGFSSKSTFNAIFKQFTGQTPTQYRKRLKSRNI